MKPSGFYVDPLFVFLLQKTKGWPQMKKPVLDERVYP